MAYDTRTFRSTGKRVGGSAEIGSVVGYADVMNSWEPCEVLSVRESDGWAPQFLLLSLETGETHYSDLRQHGWTFGEEREAGAPRSCIKCGAPCREGSPWFCAPCVEGR